MAHGTFGIEDLGGREEELAREHGLDRAEVGRVLARTADLDARLMGALLVPDLEEAIQAGCEPRATVRWLLDCDLEVEARRYTLWTEVTDPDSPTTPLNELPDVLRGAESFVANHHDVLIRDGVCEPGDSWICRWLSRLLPVQLLGDDNPAHTLTDVDTDMLTGCREALLTLATRVLIEARVAVRDDDPSLLWAFILARLPESVSPPLLSLERRLADVLAALEPTDIGGIENIARLAAHFEAEIRFAAWSDAAVVVRDTPAESGELDFYRARLGENADAFVNTVADLQTLFRRSRTYLAQRTPEMLRQVEEAASFREQRVLLRLARGGGSVGARAMYSRWRRAGRAASRATSVRPNHLPQSEPITIGRDEFGTFVVRAPGSSDAFPLLFDKYGSSSPKKGTVTGGIRCSYLRDIVMKTSVTDQRPDRLPSWAAMLTQVKRAIEAATAKAGVPVLFTGRLSPTRELAFDLETERWLAANRCPKE